MTEKPKPNGRGRPVTLTPEERLRRQRERWLNKKVRQRKRDRDEAWLRQTKFGYVETVEVLHYNKLIEVLVDDGFLAEQDVHLKARVDEAVDRLLGNKPPTSSPHAYGIYINDFFGGPRLRADIKGVVKLRMTAELVDHIVEYVVGRDGPPELKERLRSNRRALKQAVEEWLYVYYASYVFEQPRVPCNCKLALPQCECDSRFLVRERIGGLEEPPKPKGPQCGRPLVKRSLYSAPVPRWWREANYGDDSIIRSHESLANAGMQGLYVGSTRTENVTRLPHWLTDDELIEPPEKDADWDLADWDMGD